MRKRGRAALAPAVQDTLARWPKTIVNDLAKVGRAIPSPPPVANGRILVHEDGAHGVTRPTTARRRKRQPGRARSPAKSQPGGQGQFGLDERRFGRDIALRCPRWRFPVFGQRNFCLPAGDRKARAGGRRSAPSLPRREAGNGSRGGRAPQQCPSWWPCANTGQWQFGVDERGKGRLNCLATY